jgi:hypothetical protein
MTKALYLLAMFSLAVVTTGPLLGEEKARSPADGYNIHILVPHRHEDGTVHGPYHHYCKPIKPEILQCMIFLSADPNAELVPLRASRASDEARHA